MTVWDCFMFNGEVDLLEFRLRELRHVVDSVIIVEGTTTFTGLPKPLSFETHCDRFSDHLDRIHYVRAELSPASSPWGVENEQRRYMRDTIAALVAPDDLVIFGDVDEVPYRGVIAALGGVRVEPTRLVMHHALYFANLVASTPWIEGPMVFRGADLLDPMVRAQLGDPHGEFDGYRERRSPAAGWHFSFLGGSTAVRAKLAAYSHQECNTTRDNDADHLDRCLRYGVTVDGRHLLRRVGREEWDPLVRRLFEGAPQLFDLNPPESPQACRAYCAYAWARRRPWMPELLVDYLDKRDVATRRTDAFVLAGLQAALVQIRARRPLEPPPWREQPIDNNLLAQ